MTDTTQPESKPEAVNTELPTPKFTESSAGSSTSSVDTTAIAKEVAKMIMPEFQKMAQSTKDKRIAQIEKQLGIGDLDELAQMGVEIPENVKLEYRLRSLEQGRPQTPTSQGSGANLTSQDVAEVVKAFNLDANDAAVLEKLRGTYRNRDHFEAEMAKLAIANASKPQPSAAASPAISGSAAPSSGDDVGTKINRLMEMQKHPTKYFKEITELTKELDERGWK